MRCQIVASPKFTREEAEVLERIVWGPQCGKLPGTIEAKTDDSTAAASLVSSIGKPALTR